jgi:membrane protein
MPTREIVPLIKTTWSEFQRHNAQWLAAALAYFTAFAIAPLIIVLVEIAGLILGNNQQAYNEIFSYLKRDAGAGASAVEAIVKATMSQPRAGVVAQIVGWAIFVIAAIGLFNALQFALNTIWDVKSKRTGIWQAIRSRWTAFLGILGIAALLFISIMLNTVLTVLAGAMSNIGPGFPTFAKLLDFLVSFGVLWVAFAFLYKFLPETTIEWRDVWVGSGLTSFLFVVGQFLLGWYLGRAGVSSGYGAFGSLVVFLIWVYYSAQIVLFGAEFTHVYEQRRRSFARRVTTGEVERRPYPATRS